MSEKGNWPTYDGGNGSSSAELPPGMYLGLLHGRNDPTQDMDNWGFNGPMIGPLKYVHTTYGDDIKVCFLDEDDPRFYLSLVDDMIHFEGKYYGDWTVFIKS